MSKTLILSFDGGGIRGYLSSLFLQQLQKEFNILGGSNNSNIDVYAGTSTGGLIALALAAGEDVSTVVGLYPQYGQEIFTPLALQKQCMTDWEKLIPSFIADTIDELWQATYNNIGPSSLQNVIETIFPTNSVLSSLPNSVMVTTFQLAQTGPGPQNWQPLVLDNFPASPSASTTLYDAALSTSAAPIYFPPYNHPTYGWCADGGLFANDPAPLALARTMDALQQPASNIAVLSIGTGVSLSSLAVPSPLCFGINYWCWPLSNGPTPPFAIVEALFDGSAQANDYLCRQILGNNYCRINPILPSPIPLDGWQPQYLTAMQNVYKTYINSAAWPLVQNWVQNFFQH